MALGFIIYVGVLAGDALLLKFLHQQGLSLGNILAFRGLTSVALCLIFSLVHRHSILPRNPRKQLFRMVMGGVSLALIIGSYQFAYATSVSLISRLDIPILVILAHFFVRKTHGAKILVSLFCFIPILLTALLLRGPGETLLGYGMALLGTFGVSFCYILLLQSSSEEKDDVTILVISLMLVIIGAILGDIRFNFPLPSLLALIASGTLMYLVYILTLFFYRRVDIVTAEFPTLIASLLILPAEILLFGIINDWRYAVALVFEILLIGTTVAWDRIQLLLQRKVNA